MKGRLKNFWAGGRGGEVREEGERKWGWGRGDEGRKREEEKIGKVRRREEEEDVTGCTKV